MLRGLLARAWNEEVLEVILDGEPGRGVNRMGSIVFCGL